MVFHPGYDRWRYGEKQSSWLKHSLDTFHEVIEATAPTGCTIAIENIFEEEPDTLLALLEACNHPRVRHCFDVGHWNMFSTGLMEEWFAELGPFVAECHIHDNHGQADEHLPPGEGQIDFPLLFRLLGSYAPEAVCTVEAHTFERMERAMRNLTDYL